MSWGAISVGLLVIVLAGIGQYRHFITNHIHQRRSKILLFDGVCNVCNVYVNFIIQRDPQSQYYFAPLRSQVGQKLLGLHSVALDIDSLVLIDSADELVEACKAGTLDKLSVSRCPAYIRSTGAILAVASLGFPYSLLSLALLLPLPVRDVGYRVFASFRYRLFGRSDECIPPSRSTRERFLAVR